jgi:CrcB protein
MRKERTELNKYILVGMGGFLGAIARFWIDGLVSRKMGVRFPYGTFLINISGSFLIGFILTVLTERTHVSANWRYLIPIGFIGAYTTFSTFEWETFTAARDGQFLMAVLNVGLSVVLGFIAVWLGITSGSFVTKKLASLSHGVSAPAAILAGRQLPEEET